MALPAELLQAVSALGGGKITLVVGAGCSFEEPTRIPLAATISRECHDRLVANGVLSNGDCKTPDNLSSLADTVFNKTGEQRYLVELLNQHYQLKAASPNDGHLLAAALLRERAISSIVTLNFDLALSTAIGQLGVGDEVGIIDGPEETANQKVANIYYLHRNANCTDLEAWVLRSGILQSDWTGKWEAVIAAKVLATPVVVFAGLGSPADVLVESSKLIRHAIPTGNKTYQVDPGTSSNSEFFKALELAPESFIQMGWCDFMDALSERLVFEQTTILNSVATEITERESVTPENLATLLSQLQRFGLVDVGRLRASWLLYEKLYLSDNIMLRELIADLLLGVALIARITDTEAVILANGLVEFRRDHRIVATHVFVSGGGSRSLAAIEGALSSRWRCDRKLTTVPIGAVVAGVRNSDVSRVTPPRDVVLGDTTESIVFGSSALLIFRVEALRHEPGQCQKVAP